MTEATIYVMLVLPVVIVALGWGAVFLNERLTRHKHHPAE